MGWLAKNQCNIIKLGTSIVAGDSYVRMWVASQSGGFIMASPQKENGYTTIASELLEAMCRVHLSGHEWSFLHAVLRKTYGYGKKEDWITNTQIMALTGMRKERVSEAKKSLISKKIVTENRNKISIQKDYEKWIGVTENRNKSYGKPYQELRKSVPTIDNTTINNIGAGKPAPITTKNKKDMAWKKYNENQHSEDVPAIDIDSGEKLPDDKDLEREQNKKVTTLIEWAEKMRGKVFMDIPTQRKMVHTLRTKGISPTVIKQTYLDLLQSDYWKQQDRLPDFKSVVSTLKNKK